MADAGTIDLTRSEVIQDPHPTFREMRARAPLIWNASIGGWVVTRFDDVRRVLRDPRFSVEKLKPFVAHASGGRRQGAEILGHVLGRWMVFSDPPQHTRLRAALKAAFMPRAIAAMAPRVEAQVGRLLDGIAPRGRMEVIRDFAYPLPARVICDLCGVPLADVENLQDWTNDLGKFVLGARQTPDRHSRAAVATGHLLDYFRDLVADHRARPRDDVTSILIAAELDEDEILATLCLLLFAGLETTTGLIANGVLQLIRNPDQLGRLQAEPDLIDSAVEEFLRYEGPVQALARIAIEPVEIAGQALPAGARVYCIVNAANRDEAAYTEPERLDIGRERNRHLSFGQGIHLCLGAPLARLEARIAFRRLLERFAGFELEIEAPVWRDDFISRGMIELPIRFRPRA